LIEYARRYREKQHVDLKLVLTGGGALHGEATSTDGVYDLGRLDRRALFDAYAAALVLCQPSAYESFSYVLMEAWVAGTPALVYQPCAVTTDFVRQANGGLYFADYDEFEACVNVLLARPALREQLGIQGRAYVLEHFAWDVVAERYARLLAIE